MNKNKNNTQLKGISPKISSLLRSEFNTNFLHPAYSAAGVCTLSCGLTKVSCALSCRSLPLSPKYMKYSFPALALSQNNFYLDFISCLLLLRLAMTQLYIAFLLTIPWLAVYG